jgi:hypothetical protein
MQYGIWETAIPSHLPGPSGSVEPLEAEGSLHFSMHDSEDGSGEKDSQRVSTGEASGDADLDDEEGDAQNDVVPPKKASKAAVREGTKGGKDTKAEVRVEREAMKMQPPFQPGGAVSNSSRRHFLVYNMLGCITAQQEEAHTTVQVRRADCVLPASVPELVHEELTKRTC